MQEDDRVSLADRDVTHFSIEDGDTVSGMWIRWTGGHRHLFVNRACGHRFRNPIGVVGFYEQRSLADLISARNNMVSRDNAITTPGTFVVRASKSRKATRHDDEIALSALVVSIGVINLWNRLNVATPARQGVAPRAQAIHGLRQGATKLDRSHGATLSCCERCTMLLTVNRPRSGGTHPGGEAGDCNDRF